MTTQTWLYGTTDTVLSTELNSLGSTGLAVTAAAYTPTTLNYPFADVELNLPTMTAPTANTVVNVWFLPSIGGTNYESTSAVPNRDPDVFFTLGAVTSQLTVKMCRLPPGSFKVMLKNDTIGQAYASSGNTLKIKPKTYQFG